MLVNGSNGRTVEFDGVMIRVHQDRFRTGPRVADLDLPVGRVQSLTFEDKPGNGWLRFNLPNTKTKRKHPHQKRHPNVVFYPPWRQREFRELYEAINRALTEYHADDRHERAIADGERRAAETSERP